MERYWWRSQSCEDNAMFGNYYEYLNHLNQLVTLQQQHRAVTAYSATEYLTTNGACLQTDHSGTDELEILLTTIPCQMWSEK